MPVLGDISRFGIEYALDQNPGGEWLYGRFCFWLANSRLGAFSLGTSLRDVLFGLDEVAKYPSPRSTERFAHLPAGEVLRVLDDALFGDTDPAIRNVAAEEQWAKHNILPAVDVFDHCKGFIVETETSARVIVRQDGAVVEASLSAGEFDQVLSQARAALDSLYENEQRTKTRDGRNPP